MTQGPHSSSAGVRPDAPDRRRSDPATPGGIFISYRRDDTAPYAGRLYDRLCSRLGSDGVFMDLTIRPGDDWVERLEDEIASSDAFVHVIGPHWLEAAHADGRRRLDDPEDFTRLEVAAALKREVRVIPVLVGGARMPSKHDLPDDLKEFADRQAIELSDSRWDYDVDRLIDSISRETRKRRRRERTGFVGRIATKTSAQRLPRLSKLLLVVAIAAGALGVAAIVLLNGSEDTPGTQLRAGQPVNVGDGPVAVTSGQGAVWVANELDATISRVQPSTGSVVGQAIRVHERPEDVAVAAGRLWIAHPFRGAVESIRIQDGKRLQPLLLPGAPTAIAAGDGGLWVAAANPSQKQGFALRVDARTGRQAGPLIPVGGDPFDIALGFGAAWVANNADGTVTKIDLDSGKAVGDPILVGTSPTGVVAGLGGVWVVSQGDDAIVRIDPESLRVGRPIRLGRGPLSIAIAEGQLWVSNEYDGTVARVDPRAQAMVGRPLHVGRSPNQLAYADGRLWVATYDDDALRPILGVDTSPE
jgi:streptogramin lyase